jgi:hypothetical protein
VGPPILILAGRQKFCEHQNFENVVHRTPGVHRTVSFTLGAALRACESTQVNCVPLHQRVA